MLPSRGPSVPHRVLEVFCQPATPPKLRTSPLSNKRKSRKSLAHGILCTIYSEFIVSPKNIQSALTTVRLSSPQVDVPNLENSWYLWRCLLVALRCQPLAFREAKLAKGKPILCHIIYLNTCKSRPLLHTFIDREMLSLSVM